VIWLPTPPPDPPPDPPLLTVHTTPDGAVVSFHGRSLGTTPFSLALADTIEQAVLSIEKTGYVAVDTTVVVVAGELVSVILILEKSPPTVATLVISSTPGDARVQIDGEDLGSTDGAGQFPDVYVEPGEDEEVLVEIFKEGYTPWRETLQVAAGDTLTIYATFQSVLPMATLTLHARPGCSVLVAGENCTVGERCTVRAGQKQFTLRWAQGQKKVSLELNAGDQRELTCYFERKLTIQVRKEDRSPIWATILVNGVEVAGGQSGRGATGDLVLLRGPGDYRVEVRRNLFEVLDPPQRITVEPAFEEKLLPVVFRIRRQ